MDAYFQDKTAVVTGASVTICSRIAKDLASLGIGMALVGRSLEKLRKVR